MADDKTLSSLCDEIARQVMRVAEDESLAKNHKAELAMAVFSLGMLYGKLIRLENRNADT